MDKKEFEEKLSENAVQWTEEEAVPPSANMEGNNRIKESVYEWMQSVVTAILCIILLFTFFGRLMGVEGISMLPTLEERDMMLVSNLFYVPKNEDVVVIGRSYEDNGEEKLLVKRVIATGGQKIDIDFPAGKVLVNGVLLEENYIKDGIMSELNEEGYRGQVSITVPQGHVFVMGDNRDHSMDSRDKNIGMIDTRLIMGKAYAVLWPFKNLGFV